MLPPVMMTAASIAKLWGTVTDAPRRNPGVAQAPGADFRLDRDRQPAAVEREQKRGVRYRFLSTKARIMRCGSSVA